MGLPQASGLEGRDMAVDSRLRGNDGWGAAKLGSEVAGMTDGVARVDGEGRRE